MDEPIICGCEEKPAIVKVLLVDMDGTVLDSYEFCEDCAANCPITIKTDRIEL